MSKASSLHPSSSRHPLILTLLIGSLGIAISIMAGLFYHRYSEMPDSLMSGYD